MLSIADISDDGIKAACHPTQSRVRCSLSSGVGYFGLSRSPLEGLEPEAISKAIGLPAYMDPKKSVPRHAIVHGMLVKLLNEGLLRVVMGCVGYW